jgi:ATP-dependent Lon protease
MTLPADAPDRPADAVSGDGDSGNIHVPDTLPAMVINDVIIFPNTIAPLVVTAEPIIKLINDALSGSKMLAAFARIAQPKSDKPEDQFYRIGSAVQILKMFRVPDGSLRLLVQGLIRVEQRRIIETDPYLKVEVNVLPLEHGRSIKVEALMKRIVEDFTKLAEISQTIPEEVKIAVYNITDPGALADIVASNLNIPLDKKQEILEANNLEARLGIVATQIAREIQLVQLGSEIQTRVESEMAHGQREYYLREQMKAIRRELGEEAEGAAEIADLEQRVKDADMPPQAADTAGKEIDRMRRMSPASAEYTVSRTYVEWLVSLPWRKHTDEELDVDKASLVLNRDHYGLEEVKNRILEFLVIRKLRPSGHGPILCFVGPPGVGKTSLGKSIAVALNREFIRMSLGGVRDEAEIRGHRRTYVGALPGRIMQSIRRVGVNNPVIMLDEIDKLGQDFRGDPASALLEVLDPAQNSTFVDHYLDVEFDLSKVFFITTANDITQIPRALRDRMEIIEIPSYITSEKIQIAKHYLVPRQIEENGLKKSNITFTDKGLDAIIQGYTREAGVRRLEQQIASVCRKVAREVVAGKDVKVTINEKTVQDYLGIPQFLEDEVHNLPGVGVALGLGWTPVGGDVLVIESTWMPGSRQLQVTGQLGDVMKESAQIALSYLRAHADKYNIKTDDIAKHDIHIHVPAGATPKDGPSAGITLATSLASLFTQRAVKHDLAMTGEITLAGRVLPIGGLREKVVAANRYGVKTVIVPRANEKDLNNVPDYVKKAMTFLFVTNVDEVLDYALEPVKGTRSRNGRVVSRSKP